MGLQGQYDLETTEDKLARRLEMVTAHSPGSAAEEVPD
jgi:hypothetical protein